MFIFLFLFIYMSTINHCRHNQWSVTDVTLFYSRFCSRVELIQLPLESSARNQTNPFSIIIKFVLSLYNYTNVTMYMLVNDQASLWSEVNN